jgi:hypothetical protein
MGGPGQAAASLKRSQATRTTNETCIHQVTSRRRPARAALRSLCSSSFRCLPSVFGFILFDLTKNIDEPPPP